MKKLTCITIFVAFAFASAFLMSPKFTLPRIFGSVLIIWLFSKFALLHLDIDLKNTTKSVLFWCILLIFYRFLNDLLLHQWSFIECLYEIMKQSLPVLLLISIEILKIDDDKIINTIILASFVQILFGIVQIFDYRFTIDNLLSHIPFLSGPSITEAYMLATHRISGTGGISISFAEFLGIFVIIALSKIMHFKFNRSKFVPYMVLCFILILFTQTRSAIYGLLPSIMLAYFLFERINFKKICIYFLIIIALFIGFNTIEKSILEFSPRSRFTMGANTSTKLSATIYGSYAVIKENPLFGMPRSEHYKMIKKGADQFGRITYVDNRYGLVDTYHNIIGFYIKNYGLIGLSLFCLLIYNIFKKIHLKTDYQIKFILMASYIYFFQYAMLHNNSLLYSSYIWILLAIGDERPRAEEKIAQLQPKQV